MELYHARNQWAKRPADEKFASLEDMYAATKAYAVASREKEVPWSDIRVAAEGDDLRVVGKAGVPALLTNYAFKQLTARAGAPASYISTLPATLAAQNINHGLKEKAGETKAQLLFHRNGQLVLRAATSDRYERLWNHEVIARLIDTAQRNALVPARQTFSWDGSEVPADAPPALYASDHDMFAFLMSVTRDVIDPVGALLRRGVIVTNSEVGDRSLGVTGFWFRDVCCNHIIWGAQQIAEIRITHVGEIGRKWADAQARVRRYLDQDSSFEKARFEQWTRQIAGDKESVLDAVFGKRINGLSRTVIAQAYDAVQVEQDGDARTQWGLAQGITRVAQKVGQFADERNDLDRAAGRLLQVTF